MNDEQVQTVLIQALAALEAGETVEQILAHFPAEADQLQPVLRAAARLNAYGRETLRAQPTGQAQARRAFLARAAALSPSARPGLLASWLVRPLAAFLTVVALVLVIGGSVLGVSAASLPGDPLYGFKRSVETIQRSLTFDPARRVNLEESQNQRRLQEVRAVQAVKRAVSVDFVAHVETIGATMWMIGGLTVQVTPDTIIGGAPQTGDLVEVIGHTLPDGHVVADRIEGESVDLRGTVESLDGPVWIVNGRRVLVTKEARITGAVRVGAKAQVHAQRFPDGTLLALAIEFDDRELTTPGSPDATPRPSATVAPLPTKRVEPTATPRPPATSEPAEASEPRESTATPEPRPTEPSEAGRTPEPTRTPRPSQTVEQSPTPESSKTAEPGETREGSRVPEQTRVLEPTRAPQTPESTRELEPQHSPEPTKAQEPTETP